MENFYLLAVLALKLLATSIGFGVWSRHCNKTGNAIAYLNGIGVYMFGSLLIVMM